ncbi:hypothetical protein ACFFG2_10125 [Paraburkholderia solisilvae]
MACPRKGSIRISVAGMMWIEPRYRAVRIPPGVEHEVVMLAEVARQDGYANPPALTTIFRNALGFSPSHLVNGVSGVAADDA